MAQARESRASAIRKAIDADGGKPQPVEQMQTDQLRVLGGPGTDGYPVELGRGAHGIVSLCHTNRSPVDGEEPVRLKLAVHMDGGVKLNLTPAALMPVAVKEATEDIVLSGLNELFVYYQD